MIIRFNLLRGVQDDDDDEMYGNTEPRQETIENMSRHTTEDRIVEEEEE